MLWLLLYAFADPGGINLSRFELYGHGEALAVAGEDLLAVTDVAEHRFLILRRVDGSWSGRWCGRPGEAPGEFHRIGAVHWHRADRTWWVVDYRGRLSVWAEDGTYQRTFHLGATWFSSLGVTDSGRFFTAHLETFHKIDKRHRGEVLFMDGFGTEERLLYRFELPAPARPNLGTPSRPIFLKVPWLPQPALAVGADFAAVWQPDTDRLRFFNEKGQPDGPGHGVALARTPLVEAVVAETFGTRHQALRGRFSLPELMPRVQALRAGPHDRVWVFGFVGDGTVPYQVLDRRGNTVGEGSLPAVPEVITQTGFYWLKADGAGDLWVNWTPL